jgi:hypothetical protein
MSEWLKETGCKPVGYAYAGSNPAPAIAKDWGTRRGSLPMPGAPRRGGWPATGPAHYFIQADVPANSQPDHDMTVIFGHRARPPVAFTREVRVPSAGTRTYRLKMVKAGTRVARRYHRSKLRVLFPIERQDGELWSEPNLNQRTVLVR